jgi:hypothetical protein
MAAALQGFKIIRGTRYPGTIRPVRFQPNLRLKKQTTITPTHTVVMSELDSELSGKTGKIKFIKIIEFVDFSDEFCNLSKNIENSIRL